nr:hypothetical protein [Nocardia cyriacigeorgica]
MHWRASADYRHTGPVGSVWVGGGGRARARGAARSPRAPAPAPPHPAKQAMTSIATRYTMLADLLDKFAVDVEAKDAEIGAEIGKLSPR